MRQYANLANVRRLEVILGTLFIAIGASVFPLFCALWIMGAQHHIVRH